MINDSIAVYAYLAETGDKSVKIAANTGEKSEQGFAARKNSGLLPDLNKALDELRSNGTLADHLGEILEGQRIGRTRDTSGRCVRIDLAADSAQPRTAGQGGDHQDRSR